MGMPKSCPRCGKRFSSQDLRSFSNRIGVPKTAPCSSCGTQLRWCAMDWWLTHAAALIIFGGVVGLLASALRGLDDRYVGGFLAVILAGVAVTFIGLWRLRLRVLQSPRDGE